MTLSTKQTKFLKSEAHSLKPVIIIGNHGLTDAVIDETNLVLDTHELIKVRVNAENREDKVRMCNGIVKQTDSNLVQIIGHIAIIYRARKKNPTIALPKN